MFKKFILVCAMITAITAAAQTDKANVSIDGAWIRATVAGQQGTGGFMKLTAHEDLRLVGVSTSATPVAEIHEMKMAANNVMAMRPIAGLDLPKGQTVELKPGGYHLMLMDLKQVLAQGSSIPLTLHFKDAKGRASKLDTVVTVGQTRPQAPAGEASPPLHAPMQHKH